MPADFPSSPVNGQVYTFGGQSWRFVSGSPGYWAPYADPMFQICTSTTRPTSPARGTKIYETDTFKELVYYGAVNGWKPPWDRAWGLIDRQTDAVDRTYAAAGDLNISCAGQITGGRYYRIVLQAALGFTAFPNEITLTFVNGVSGAGTVLATVPGIQMASGIAAYQVEAIYAPGANDAFFAVHPRTTYLAAASLATNGASRAPTLFYVEDIGGNPAALPAS